MKEDLKEKIKNFIHEYCEYLEKDPKNKEKYYNELKEFTIEVGCELFNKTKEDYENVSHFAKFLHESDLINKDRTLVANYLALCNLISLYKNQMIENEMKELGIT